MASRKLRYLQNVLNNSGIQQTNNALYQVISEILQSEFGNDEEENNRDRLTADNNQFVLDPFTGLYLQNTGQSGSAEFPFRVDENGIIYERFRTLGIGSWQQFTSSWINVAGDTNPGTGGSVVGRYTLVGDICFVYIRLLLGTGFSFGTPQTSGLTLPINVAFGGPIATNRYSCNAAFLDGAAPYLAHSRIGVLSGQHAVLLNAVDMSTGGFATATATVPFTWAAGDMMVVSAFYQAAI